MFSLALELPLQPKTINHTDSAEHGHSVIGLIDKTNSWNFQRKSHNSHLLNWGQTLLSRDCASFHTACRNLFAFTFSNGFPMVESWPTVSNTRQTVPVITTVAMQLHPAGALFIMWPWQHQCFCWSSKS